MYLGPFGVLIPWTKEYVAAEIPFKIKRDEFLCITHSLYPDVEKYGGLGKPELVRSWSRGTAEFGELDLETKSYHKLDLEVYGPYGVVSSNDLSLRAKW